MATATGSEALVPHVPVFNHVWAVISDNPGTWRCTPCGIVANTGQPMPPQMQGCRGYSNVLSRVGRGHRLVQYPPHPDNPDQSSCIACELCHRCGTSKPVFVEACLEDPTPARTRAYKRFEAGKHPHNRWGDAILYSSGQWIKVQVTEANP